MHYVLLINREVGLSQDIYPVCGKSTKCYGQATLDHNRRAVAFKMSIEDYERDKWDILGNRGFLQIWVPEFVVEPDAAPALPVKLNLDDMKWHELVKLGQNMGVYKVGQTRLRVIELIRGQMKEKQEAA